VLWKWWLWTLKFGFLVHFFVSKSSIFYSCVVFTFQDNYRLEELIFMLKKFRYLVILSMCMMNRLNYGWNVDDNLRYFLLEFWFNLVNCPKCTFGQLTKMLILSKCQNGPVPRMLIWSNCQNTYYVT